jgi:hypothetical protein
MRPDPLDHGNELDRTDSGDSTWPDEGAGSKGELGVLHHSRAAYLAYEREHLRLTAVLLVRFSSPVHACAAGGTCRASKSGAGLQRCHSDGIHWVLMFSGNLERL